MSDAVRHSEKTDSVQHQRSDLNLCALLQNGASVAVLKSDAGSKVGLPLLTICDQTANTTAKLAREAELLARGVVGGAIKEAEKDPCGVAVKAVAAVGVGAVLGVAATAASPWIAGTAVAVGVAGTGTWLWNTFNPFDARNQQRNEAVSRAVQQTWASNDRGTLNHNVKVLEEKLGKDSLDLGLGLISGATASGAAKFVPGMMCREMPSVGFRFFSQSAIEKAFPQRSREFQISDLQALAALRVGEPVQVSVREILGQSKSGADIAGPEKSLLIGHELAREAKLPQTDLIATCRPELLEPLLRVKSVLQQAADVELQVDAAARRLRFLTADQQRTASTIDSFKFDERFGLGVQHAKEMPLAEMINALRSNKLGDSLQPATREALRHHDLREIEVAFSEPPYKVSGIKGAGAESIVFELAPSNDAPIFAAENVKPSDVVLKVSNPKYAVVHESFGMRPFDAKRIGEFEYGRNSDYVAYLQEKVEPVNLDDVVETDYAQLRRLLQRERCVFFDRQGEGQLGYTADGKLVVIDWFAALSEDLCASSGALFDDFKPTK